MPDNLPTVNLAEIEERMLQLPQAPCPVSHHFGPGLYIREMRVEAGVLALGHSQRFHHMNVFIAGKVLILNPDGTKTILEAPMTFVGPPGRKVGYVLEDMIWQNVYATEERDVEKLEEMFLDKTEYSKDHYRKEAEVDYSADREDYYLLLEEFAIPAEQVVLEVQNQEDQIEMPYGWHKSCVRTSPLHGKGLFASAPFATGEVIAPARIGDKRTPAGRYTNHSCKPNAGVFPVGEDVVLIALRDITGCVAGGNGEEITIDYREALRLRGFEQKGV